MLTDVLGAAEAWPLRMVVTADAAAASVARQAGWAVVADPGSGLNAAIAAGTAKGVAEGATALLVLPSDVPLVNAREIRSVFDADADVAVARSDDGGTTGLLRRPPQVIEATFGPDSASAHLQAGQRAGLRVRSLRLPGLALDVDTLEDLRLLARAQDGASSVKVARDLLDPRGLEIQ
jgi:2-phospho-L-lactate guanylyltransferase